MIEANRQRFEYFMRCFVVVSQFTHIFAITKIYKNQEASGVSLWAYAYYVLTSLVWIAYGYCVLQPVNKTIILGSSIAIVLALVIIAGIFLYSKDPWSL